MLGLKLNHVSKRGPWGLNRLNKKSSFRNCKSVNENTFISEFVNSCTIGTPARSALRFCEGKIVSSIFLCPDLHSLAMIFDTETNILPWYDDKNQLNVPREAKWSHWTCSILLLIMYNIYIYIYIIYSVICSIPRHYQCRRIVNGALSKKFCNILNEMKWHCDVLWCICT